MNKIIFLNQTTGHLFLELVEGLAKKWPGAILYTARSEILSKKIKNLDIIYGPKYDRRGLFRRFFSWLHYFFSALIVVWQQPKDFTLFFVSEPPFLGLIGLFFKIIRKQKYVVLVYDIYPDVLVGMNFLKKGVFVRCWKCFNRQVLIHADLVITIGRDMLGRLKKEIYLSGSFDNKLIYIPNWADTEKIKPLTKERNWFAKKHHIVGTTNILYSGNMGYTHDIETILKVAEKLKNEKNLHFLLIGDGKKYAPAKKFSIEKNLTHITFFPLQSEKEFPYSLASGDIGIISYEPETEGCMLPSKAYYYMAAGVAPFVLCTHETDLKQMVLKRKCGIWMKNEDIEGIADMILNLHHNPVALEKLKHRARQTAVELYSKKNIDRYVEALETVMF